MRSISKKIILTGSFCVGKTSLISRFVYQRFLLNYQTTMGVRIDKKTILVEDVTLNMIVWDIGGEQSQSRIPDSYYLGSSGIIYIFDVSRPVGFKDIENDINFLKQRLPYAPIVVVGNKSDLVDANHLEEIRSLVSVPIDFFTSAKDGLYIEETFLKLAQMIIHEN